MAQPAQSNDWYVLPQAIDQSLKSVLDLEAMQGRLTDTVVCDLSERISAGSVPRYEVDWAAFTYYFFPANLHKAMLASRFLRGRLPRKVKVIDLGCGSGATSAGLVYGLAQACPEVEQIEITAIDRCQEQLCAYITLMSAVSSDTHISIKFVTKCREVLEYIDEPRALPDLVMSSYLLTELDQAARMKVEAFHDKCVLAGRSSLRIDKDMFLDSYYSVNGQGIGRFQQFKIFGCCYPTLLNGLSILPDRCTLGEPISRRRHYG